MFSAADAFIALVDAARNEPSVITHDQGAFASGDAEGFADITNANVWCAELRRPARRGNTCSIA